LAVVEFGFQFLQIDKFTSDYKIVFLIIGALVGLIPESGPHLIFVILFAKGLIPFSVLITSSIVQDGHGALPLLAESRKSFIHMKAINLVVGLLAGIIGILSGF
jgi:hypothetical protein